MKQLIAGNWKMNGLRAEALALAEALRAGAEGLGCDLLVCPPSTVLAAVAERLRGCSIMVGGQDCHPEPNGARTGDVSAPMLKDAGADWVIVGHSERRLGDGGGEGVGRGKGAPPPSPRVTPPL